MPSEYVDSASHGKVAALAAQRDALSAALARGANALPAGRWRLLAMREELETQQSRPQRGDPIEIPVLKRSAWEQVLGSVLRSESRKLDDAERDTGLVRAARSEGASRGR